MTFKNNLKGYRLEYAPQAKKTLSKLHKNIAKNIYDKLDDLVEGKQNLDITKLSGYQGQCYRLRTNDYRIIYTVWEDQVIVYVIEIGHRREIYRD